MNEQDLISGKSSSRRSVLRNCAVGGSLLLGGTAVGGTAVAAPDSGGRRSGKFQLHAEAELIDEPGASPTNHVLRIDTSEDGRFGSASRQLGVNASDLDGRLSFDYTVAEGDCGGGSPRLILSIDDAGDGEHDFYLVTDGSGSPGWESCPDARSGWASFDGTDDADTYWRIHPGTGYLTWSEAKAELGSEHAVLSGALVDDSYWKAGVGGVAYYDEITIGDRTLSGNDDVVGSR